MNRTWIVGVKGKHADHLTATTALMLTYCLVMVFVIKFCLYFREWDENSYNRGKTYALKPLDYHLGVANFIVAQNL